MVNSEGNIEYFLYMFFISAIAAILYSPLKIQPRAKFLFQIINVVLFQVLSLCISDAFGSVYSI